MHAENQGHSDAELARRAAAGDRVAFGELLRRHDRRVVSLAFRFAGSPDDARDIYQEVFMRVHAGLGRFRGDSEFGTWLHRITVNVCLSYREARKRRERTVEAGEERDGPEPAAAEGSTPETELLNLETRQRVRRALEALPPRQRMVFILRHYEGYRLREIAATMKCAQGTVKRYLFEATRAMRDQLQDLL